MSDHEWCQDVPRDQAVRAAEDAAATRGRTMTHDTEEPSAASAGYPDFTSRRMT